MNTVETVKMLQILKLGGKNLKNQREEAVEAEVEVEAEAKI